jgi:hypothetical protein
MTQETISRKDSVGIKASFQQKSAGVSLFIIGSTAIYYFAQAWPMRPIALAGTPVPAGYGGLVLTTLGVIILAQIVLQIVLVIGTGGAAKPTAEEQIAAMKAKRNANGILTAGILAVIGLLFVGFPAFCMANLAMLSLLLAEIIKFASQLFYYRQAA